MARRKYIATHTLHGQSRTYEYAAWARMLRRCRNPEHHNFHRYGGRGITVCERWDFFPNFLADVGIRPTTRHTLGRIDNDGHYEPGNVRWETPKEQGANRSTSRRVTAFGETLILAEWSRRVGLPFHLISDRLNSGWTAERALSEPAQIQVAGLVPRKLTDAQEIEICALRGQIPQREIAQRFGIAPGSIWKIHQRHRRLGR